jgi:Trypsin-like peptidase domain
VIPEGGGSHAVFRYFADLVAADARNVDACVLHIRSRLPKDISTMEGMVASNAKAYSIPVSELSGEDLKSLKMTKHFELEESIRVTGFNQGGEGILERGKHICTSADFISGYICRHFKPAMHDNSFSSDSSTSQARTFAPKEEIVVVCSTISGHSGGPCVNNDKKVLGILSRADPVDPTRCYLVPATEIKPLIVQARNLCSLPLQKHRLHATQTM